jgi:hypothetical protein
MCASIVRLNGAGYRCLAECVRRGDFVEVTLAEVTLAFESWRDATIVICIWPSWPFIIIIAPPCYVILSSLPLPKPVLR